MAFYDAILDRKAIVIWRKKKWMNATYTRPMIGRWTHLTIERIIYRVCSLNFSQHSNMVVNLTNDEERRKNRLTKSRYNILLSSRIVSNFPFWLPKRPKKNQINPVVLLPSGTRIDSSRWIVWKDTFIEIWWCCPCRCYVLKSAINI